MQRSDHVRLLRVFHTLFGALVLSAAFFAPSMQRAFGWGHGLGAWGAWLVALLGVVGLLHLAAGMALPGTWGRALSIVAAVASLPSIPFGTALGIYALVVHLGGSHEVPG